MSEDEKEIRREINHIANHVKAIDAWLWNVQWAVITTACVVVTYYGLRTVWMLWGWIVLAVH